MKKNYILMTVLFLINSLSLSAQKIEYKDGVKIIHNEKPLWGNNPKVALEFVRKIGELEGDDENYQFYRPDGIVKDNSGNLYILDSGNNRIQVFDSNGNYKKTIGREGKGPVEFSSPEDININDNENLYVCDFMNRRLQIIDLDGSHIGGFTMPKRFSSFEILSTNEIVFEFFMEMYYQLLREKKIPPLLHIVNSAGKIIKEFGKRKEYKNIDFTYWGNITELAIDEKDYIYVLYLSRNNIEKYSSDGKLIFKADRPLNFKTENFSFKKENYGGREIERATTNTVSLDIGIDIKSRLWITTYKSQPEEKDRDSDIIKTNLIKLEIFNNEGILMGEIPVDFHFSSMRIFDDYIYFVDTGRAVCVYEYRIVEK